MCGCEAEVPYIWSYILFIAPARENGKIEEKSKKEKKLRVERKTNLQ